MDMPVFREVAEAKPSAELRPLGKDAKPQLDEEEMGLSYAELDLFAGLRKIDRMGPLTMYSYLLLHWSAERNMTPIQIADKVKMFYRFYGQNRHKVTTLTPAYHAEGYGFDDNRFDLRPFLYDNRWEVQFEQIDLIANQLTEVKEAATK